MRLTCGVGRPAVTLQENWAGSPSLTTSLSGVTLITGRTAIARLSINIYPQLISKIMALCACNLQTTVFMAFLAPFLGAKWQARHLAGALGSPCQPLLSQIAPSLILPYYWQNWITGTILTPQVLSSLSSCTKESHWEVQLSHGRPSGWKDVWCFYKLFSNLLLAQATRSGCRFKGMACLLRRIRQPDEKIRQA